MGSFRNAVLIALIGLTGVGSGALTLQAQDLTPAQQGLARLKALEGDWIDVEGAFGTKGALAVTYRVTSGGHSVVETFPVKTSFEMVTVYHLDGADLLLTHFCSTGNQPRMRSKGLQGNVLAFDFAGGTNIDPARTSHMHAAKIEFISADEIRATWTYWKDGQPTGQNATFRIVRKK